MSACHLLNEPYDEVIENPFKYEVKEGLIPDGKKLSFSYSFNELFKYQSPGNWYERDSYKNIVYFPKFSIIVVVNSKSIVRFIDVQRSSTEEGTTFLTPIEKVRLIGKWDEETLFCGELGGSCFFVNVESRSIRQWISSSFDRIPKTSFKRPGNKEEPRKYLKVSEDEYIVHFKTYTCLASYSQERVIQMVIHQKINESPKFIKCRTIPNSFIFVKSRDKIVAADLYGLHQGEQEVVISILHDYRTNQELKKFSIQKRDFKQSYSQDTFLDLQNREFLVSGGGASFLLIHSIDSGQLLKRMKCWRGVWCSGVISDQYFVYGSCTGAIEVLDMRKITFSEEDESVESKISVFSDNVMEERGNGIMEMVTQHIPGHHGSDKFRIALISSSMIKLLDVESSGLLIVDKKLDQDEIERIEYLRSEYEIYLSDVGVNGMKIVVSDFPSVFVFSKLLLLK